MELGIPEAVGSHVDGGRPPITLPQLVSALGLPPAKAPFLARLMRVLVHTRFINSSSSSESGGFTLTPAGKMLLPDNPFNAGSHLLVVVHPLMVDAYSNLSAWFRSEKDGDATPFFATHGKSMWEYQAGDEKFAAIFDEAMARDSSLIAHVLLKEGRGVFDGVGSLVDVAGGTGTMARAIGSSFPDMACTVLDLPHVISGLEDSGNLKFVAGDMFRAIPSADVVLLKWILHDWSDENCTKILKKCKEAVTTRNEKSGKVIIIDAVIEKAYFDDETMGAMYGFDIEMMSAISGKERDEKEWGKLLLDSGFSSYHISPILGTRALIQAYP